MHFFGVLCLVAVACALPVTPEPPTLLQNNELDSHTNTQGPVEQKFEGQYPKLQEEKARNLILKESYEAKPEEQIYNEQNPVSEEEKVPDLILKEAQQSKPQEQKYDEQNPASQEQKDHDIIFEEVNEEKQEEQNNKVNTGPSVVKIIEYQPNENGKLSSDGTSISEPEFLSERKKPKARLVIPEPPRFSTRLSVPPLPISLSSLPSLGIKWPFRVPDMFKPPKIIYLG